MPLQIRWVLFFVLLAGCQTSAVKDFAKIQPGMEKGDVLDIMGDPQRKIRVRGTDKWTYVFYDQKSRTEKEVHFVDGKAVYVGDYVPPKVTAEERDQQNEAANLELEKRLARQREEASGNLQRYEAEARGEDPDDEEAHVPQYKAVP